MTELQIAPGEGTSEYPLGAWVTIERRGKRVSGAVANVAGMDYYVEDDDGELINPGCLVLELDGHDNGYIIFDPTDEPEPWVKVNVPDIREVRARVCTYRCGECSYLQLGTWGEHQAHYEAHIVAARKEKSRLAGIRAAVAETHRWARTIPEQPFYATLEHPIADTLALLRDLHSVARR